MQPVLLFVILSRVLLPVLIFIADLQSSAVIFSGFPHPSLLCFLSCSKTEGTVIFSSILHCDSSVLFLIQWKPADKVAAAGFFVVVPDFFYGDPVNPDNPQFDRESWFKAHSKTTCKNQYNSIHLSKSKNFRCSKLATLSPCTARYLLSLRKSRPRQGSYGTDSNNLNRKQ